MGTPPVDVTPAEAFPRQVTDDPPDPRREELTHHLADRAADYIHGHALWDAGQLATDE